jgi:phytoene desaturase
MPPAAVLAPPPRSSRSRERRRSVLIVGAGPGGLAAALLLRRAGLDVRVVERLPRAGGRCSAIEADGFRFDLGPTFFLYPQVLERIFRLIGRDLHAEIPMVRLDPQYRIAFGPAGGYLNCTPDLARMEAEVAKLSADDARNIRRFLAANRVKLERFRPVLERPFLGWRDLLSWELVKLLPLLRPWASVDAELGRYFADPRVRLAFTFQAKYLGMSPFNCPSLFSILSYLEYDFGVWHPYGGCSAVSEGMARVAEELGVQFQLGEEVTQLLFDGRRAIGVQTSAGEYRADAVVVNADFAHAMTKFVPNHLRRRWTDEKIDRKRFSCSTFMMYLGLDGLYDELPHHTIYTAEDYQQNLHDIERGQRLSEDPSFYVQNASVTDASLAPRGRSALYVLAPVPHRSAGIDWTRETPGFRARVLRQLAKIGLTDVERRIRFEKIVTPADWESGYAVFKGATFNLAHTLRQMLHLRPRNRFEDLDGVYLVGGGTHPGSGLPVIYESARITSRLLLQEFGEDVGWLGEPGAKDIPLSLTAVTA